MTLSRARPLWSRFLRGHLGVMRLIVGSSIAGTGSRGGYSQRKQVVVHRARRRPAAVTDLDVTAAGI
jgi:hypothetical protein